MSPMTQSTLLLFAALAMSLTGCAARSADRNLNLDTRSRFGVPKDAGPEAGIVETKVTWDPKKTAIIVVDMWDDHWCKAAAARVAEMASPMNQMLKTARAKGVFIIHAPSSVTAFYENTPQRKLAQSAPFADTSVPLSTVERWGTCWLYPDHNREPALPIDDSDMGCDLAVHCKVREAWTRQIATIEIAKGDAITDNGQEAWNLLQARKIDNVILCGVHLNMCVLGRPVGIRQMVHLGKNVVLMRDMTDTMYNHEMPPHVNHFVGTGLVVKHVERYWCPSITSASITGHERFRFVEDPRR